MTRQKAFKHPDIDYEGRMTARLSLPMCLIPIKVTRVYNDEVGRHITAQFHLYMT